MGGLSHQGSALSGPLPHCRDGTRFVNKNDKDPLGRRILNDAGRVRSRSGSRGSLAIEYAPLGIRVNTISAGIIDTPMHASDSHEFLKGLSPAQRIGTTAEMADALLFLEGATFVSGEILHVDGGAHAGKWS
jgi:hypothetical protein